MDEYGLSVSQFWWGVGTSSKHLVESAAFSKVHCRWVYQQTNSFLLAHCLGVLMTNPVPQYIHCTSSSTRRLAGPSTYQRHVVPCSLGRVETSLYVPPTFTTLGLVRCSSNPTITLRLRIFCAHVPQVNLLSGASRHLLQLILGANDEYKDIKYCDFP